MDDQRMELGAVELSDVSRELLVRGIMARAAAELARRAEAELTPLMVLTTWARPALAAAAVVAAVGLSVLAGHRGSHDEPLAGFTDALEVPAPMDVWLVSNQAPTIADMMVALEQETR